MSDASQNYGISHHLRPFDYLSLKQIEIIESLPQEVDYSVNDTYKDKYQQLQKGEKTSSIVAALINCLDVDSVWLTSRGSVSDCKLKVDIFFTVGDGNNVIGLQIKSSQIGYDKHSSLGDRITFTLDGVERSLPKPGCVWLNDDASRVAFLKELSTYLGIPVRTQVVNATKKLGMIKKLASGKKQFDLSDKMCDVVPGLALTSEETYYLSLLRVIKVSGSVIFWS